MAAPRRTRGSTAGGGPGAAERAPRAGRDGRASGSPAATQEAILAAAIKLFAAKGYSRTSTQEITAAAGVTTGALYHHFSGKEDLLKRIHDDITDAVLAATRPIVEAGGPPSDTFRALLVAQMAAIHTRGDEIGVVMRERRAFSPDVWKDVRQQRAEVEHLYIDLIEAGQRSGRFRDDVDPKVIAFGLLGMMSSVTEWYRPGRLPPGDIARMFADTFLAGLEREE